jgi:histone deacetylase 1/2
MYLLVYVDDIIVISSSSAAVDRLISSLCQQFTVKDLGDLHYFLGIEVSRLQHGLSLSQRQYALELLARVGMSKCSPFPTPMSSTDRLCAAVGEVLSTDDATTYRSLVGGLQYLALTQPDIAYAVNCVCQYLHDPRSSHWSVVKRILWYVRGSLSHGLFI